MDSSLKVIREKMKRGRSLNVDVTRQPNSEEMGSREASNSPVTPMGSTESSKNGGNANKKTKRGPTRMGIIKDKFQRLEVEWNEKGQPIGFNSISFASFLGATIRENVPITTKSWEDKKEDLWTLITQRFHIEDYHRNYVMQAMGNYLRQSRSDTSKLVREAAKKSEGKERAIAMCRPANVSNDKEWNDWVKYILSPEFESKSKKFKEIRAKHKLDHTTGRQGCARLEQSMIENSETPEDVKRWCVYTKAHTRKNGEPVNTATKEVLDQMAAYVEENQSATQSELITEDPVTKVLGPERRGRVRGLGFGATPSKLNAVIAANGRVRELEKKLDTQDYKVQILEKKVSKVDQLEDNLRKLSELYSKQNQQTESRIVDDMTRSGKCGETNGGNNSNMPKENVRCELLHWYNYDIDEVVAEGTIASTDPKTKIHHMPLGRDCWKVWVDSVIEPNISLYRPTSEAHILNEALGSTVAWPKSSIKLLE